MVISVNNVEVAARMAALGFDFLWLETEHSPLSLETIHNIVLATRGLPAVPLARPPVNELWTAKRLLDMGVLGVIFPFTSSPELARRAVAACRYPPTGLRGSGADLARLRWSEAANYYDFADESVLVVAMIEDVQGLSCIDEIAAVPGIDVLFIGTSDLSFSLGLRGEQHHRRLEAAVARITAAAKRHGKVLGRPGPHTRGSPPVPGPGVPLLYDRHRVGPPRGRRPAVFQIAEPPLSHIGLTILNE